MLEPKDNPFWERRKRRRRKRERIKAINICHYILPAMPKGTAHTKRRFRVNLHTAIRAGFRRRKTIFEQGGGSGGLRRAQLGPK